VLAVLLAATALPADAAPTAEPPPFSEVIEVQELELEVVATDRQGAAVRNLAAADFQVFEDGVQVPLSHFERVGPESGPETAAGSPPAPAAEDPGLQVAIFLDEVHVSAASRRRLGAGSRSSGNAHPAVPATAQPAGLAPLSLGEREGRG
jgi:hypothetical protein